ncbi:hypothetical protein [Amycolatopsis sp. A1MSW2902]
MKLGSLAGTVSGDLAEQHALLRDSYAEAAQRRLAVVLWWD